MYHKAKHIDTRTGLEVSSGDNPAVKLCNIDGSEQPCDMFTRALPSVSFEKDVIYCGKGVQQMTIYVRIYNFYSVTVLNAQEMSILHVDTCLC